MNIYYDSSYGSNSFVIEEADEYELYGEKKYEFKMITGNDIPVFLHSDKHSVDGKTLYTYNTLGMINLKELSERNPLKYEELCQIIISLDRCVKYIDEFLLSLEGLILDPEYIFYDRKTKEIKYCFYPLNTNDVYKNYTTLTEFLLPAIDYDDEKAVSLAYEIYAMVLNKNYDLHKLIETEVVEEQAENIEDAYKKPDCATKELKDVNQNEIKKRKNGFGAVIIVTLVVLIILFLIGYMYF